MGHSHTHAPQRTRTRPAAPPARDLHPYRRSPAPVRPCELAEDKLYGHIKPRKTRTRFLEFGRYLRSCTRPAPASRSSATTSAPHLSTAKDTRVGTWAKANNVEIAYTPTNSSWLNRIEASSWLNRIEAQFTALRYFALDGTDHASHKEQASMIRRYIIWRNNHAYDERLRRIIDRANVA